jgi:hypothetical protein
MSENSISGPPAPASTIIWGSVAGDVVERPKTDVARLAGRTDVAILMIMSPALSGAKATGRLPLDRLQASQRRPRYTGDPGVSRTPFHREHSALHGAGAGSFQAVLERLRGEGPGRQSTSLLMTRARVGTPAHPIRLTKTILFRSRSRRFPASKNEGRFPLWCFKISRPLFYPRNLGPFSPEKI